MSSSTSTVHSFYLFSLVALSAIEFVCVTGELILPLIIIIILLD